MTQATDSLLLDLTDTLTGQVELLANLLEGHLRASDAEEVLDDVALTLRESLECTVDLCGKRLVDKATIGIRRIGIDQDIEQRVILSISEGSIDRDMATCNAQCVGNLLLRQLQLIR